MPGENPDVTRRRAAESKGRVAEALIAAQFAAQGYDILARRLRTQAGEIDLIVADRKTLVFIEVKARRSYIAAAYATMPRQQRRLLAAADAALAAHEAWQRPDTRFDVALVCENGIEHIKDAIRYN